LFTEVVRFLHTALELSELVIGDTDLHDADGTLTVIEQFQLGIRLQARPGFYAIGATGPTLPGQITVEFETVLGDHFC